MPLTLTLANLAAMPRQTVRIPNPDGSMAVYEGVSLFDVLKKAGVPFGGELRGKALASYVLAKASDGYQVAFTPGEIDPSFGNQTILIADHRDGAAAVGKPRLPAAGCAQRPRRCAFRQDVGNIGVYASAEIEPDSCQTPKIAVSMIDPRHSAVLV